MSAKRAFSTARGSFVRWIGYDRTQLDKPYDVAADTYSKNGAVKVGTPAQACNLLLPKWRVANLGILLQKVGEIKSIEIL